MGTPRWCATGWPLTSGAEICLRTATAMPAPVRLATHPSSGRSRRPAQSYGTECRLPSAGAGKGGAADPRGASVKRPGPQGMNVEVVSLSGFR